MRPSTSRNISSLHISPAFESRQFSRRAVKHEQTRKSPNGTRKWARIVEEQFISTSVVAARSRTCSFAKWVAT
eukprot:1188552-Prorocentrum_minimum.AAC.3